MGLLGTQIDNAGGASRKISSTVGAGGITSLDTGFHVTNSTKVSIDGSWFFDYTYTGNTITFGSPVLEGSTVVVFEF